MPNDDLAKLLIKAIQENAEETLGVISRTLVLVSHDVGQDLEFNCDLGTVSIERKER